MADATALSYADDSFDAVLIANALHVMPEPEKALREIDRALRLGGILIAPVFPIVKEGKEGWRQMVGRMIRWRDEI